jgi:hypothetical protein
MAEVKGPFVLDLTVTDITYRVHVDEYGQFNTIVNDMRISAESLEGLRRNLATVTRRAKVKVAVKYSRLDFSRIIDGVATSVHAKTKNVMAVENGKSLQLEYGTFFHSLSPDEKKTIIELHNAKLEADKAYNEFIRQHHINLRSKVEKEVEETMRHMAGQA